MDAEKLKEMGVQICIPGMRLSAANKEYASGPGTYELKGYIYATLAGLLKMLVDEKTQVTIVTVESPRTPSVLPKTGDVVTAKVTVVNPRQVNCAILCVGPSVLARPYRGLPMTEIHWYHLSTSENELGVVIATAEGSPQGVSMIPTSWSEMQCPQTLMKEPRKVARVIPEKLIAKAKKEKIANKENEFKKEVADEEME
ncbi:Exosomal 3'-5' exoribonuclease complex subunit ski4 [Operophtera brumata]|uniref:Exosomal 3'-5' exoribonuclease complex subunit ski4 n=1 Tax=Operophtera brumata TaxID=104452 RepID=A0A0L7L5U1_OPEBR|nr:Exosomal 3'-5' exoribonuclease complex subunit ski4 [Operophtera brumata]